MFQVSRSYFPITPNTVVYLLLKASLSSHECMETQSQVALQYHLIQFICYVLCILLCDKTVLGLELLSFCSGRSVRFIHLTLFSKPSSLLKGAPLWKTLSQLCLEALDYFGSSRWCFPRLTPLFRKRCGTSLRELIQTDNPFSPGYS